jgi:cephalosporin hydroxylase
MSVRSTVGHRLRRSLPAPAFEAVSAADRRVRRQAGRLTSRRAARARAKDFRELAAYYRTDKWGRHRYAQHYQHHLEQFRHRRFAMLEIGIGGYKHEGKGGASLRAWQDFFPNAQIIGLDIEDKSFVDGGRIRSYQGSQADPDLLLRLNREAGPFLVIIDDGSHRPEHIRASFEVLFPLLLDGGIYVIEDTQTSYWPEWGGAEDRQDRTTSMALVKDLIDGLNYEEYVDESYRPTYTDQHIVAVHCYHNLVVLEKGRNNEGTAKRRFLAARYAKQ